MRSVHPNDENSSNATIYATIHISCTSTTMYVHPPKMLTQIHVFQQERKKERKKDILTSSKAKFGP